MNITFTKMTYNSNKHKKRWSVSLAIRELQIKTTGRYDYTTIRMDKIKIADGTKYQQKCREINSNIAHEYVKMIQPL